jgi:hypothetical protein
MDEEKKSRSIMRTIMIVIVTIILTLIIAAIALFSYLLIKNPLNIRGVIFNRLFGESDTTQVEPAETMPATGSQPSSTQPPAGNLPISSEQQKALEAAGINPGTINITPEMEACFIEKLGNTRVEEIKNGAIPNPLDIFKARSCL